MPESLFGGRDAGLGRMCEVPLAIDVELIPPASVVGLHVLVGGDEAVGPEEGYKSTKSHIQLEIPNTHLETAYVKCITFEL